MVEGDIIDVYSVLTDAGNIMKLTLKEMEEMFHRPAYLTNCPVALERKGENCG